MSSVKITKWQMISVGVCYMIGAILHLSEVSATAGRDAWLMPVAGLIMFVPTAAIYCLLVKLHPQKCLYEINEQALGKTLGKVFTFLYMLFFFHICTLNTMQAEAFVSAYLLPGTPVIVCGLMMTAFCAFAIYRGLRAIIVIPFAFGIVSGAYLLFNFLQSVPQMRPEFLRPMLAQEPRVYLHAAHIEATVIYGEIIGLLTFAGMLEKKTKFSVCFIITMIISCLYLILVHLRERTLLGDLTPYVSFPSFGAVRMIGNVTGTLSRVESIYSLVMIAFSIFRVLITLWAVITALKQVFNLQSYTSLIIPAAALAAVYSMRIYASPNDSYIYGLNTTPFVWTVFTFIMPLITLVFAAARRLLTKMPTPNTSRKLPEQGAEPSGAEGF
ncbi:MAG: spore germination protein [Oscillospiraceae bacterium]|jgi:spore germination protein KB|nr:spore germination protein [Oscillospiraceae bacterium]